MVALLARAGGNSALVGASGAVVAEATARLIRNQLYGDVSDNDLTPAQKQTISALSTLAAGVAGSAVGKDALSAVAAAQVGKNAVENNQLSAKDVVDLQTELAIANKKGEPTEAIWAKYKKLSAEKRAEMLAGCAGTVSFCSVGYQSEYEGGIQTADSVSSLRWFFGLSEADASRLREFVTEENQYDMGLLYNSLPTWEKATLIGKEVLASSAASIGRNKTSIASIVGKGKGGQEHRDLVQKQHRLSFCRKLRGIVQDR
ncbi:VENN motif pre-toxin domain-containing protein [Pseudomonas fluorescens]